MSNLDGVIGDARKRIEGTDRESTHPAQCECHGCNEQYAPTAFRAPFDVRPMCLSCGQRGRHTHMRLA